VVISQVMPSPFDVAHPLVARYQREMKAGGQTFSYGSLEGCFSALIFAEALDRAGPQPDRHALLAAFETIRGFKLEGVRLDYGPRDHQGMDEVFLTRVQNGKPVQVRDLSSR
jgi:ABC-type branched-subunit amino acid transport system substrate-binding protein